MSKLNAAAAKLTAAIQDAAAVNPEAAAIATAAIAAESGNQETAAAAPAAAPAVEFKPVTFGRKTAANRLFSDAAVIYINPEMKTENGGIRPVKRGAAATRFALYRDGMTVAAYIAAVVAAGAKPAVATADLKFDTDRGFIAVKA